MPATKKPATKKSPAEPTTTLKVIRHKAGTLQCYDETTRNFVDIQGVRPLSSQEKLWMNGDCLQDVTFDILSSEDRPAQNGFPANKRLVVKLKSFTVQHGETL